MKTSSYLLATLRDTPADVDIISHQLMLRAGMVRQVAAGIYTWLPLGLRVLHKVEAVVREEMDDIGAQEILMPAMQPADLWETSKRWEQYGPELMRLSDRHQRAFCLGPTHEEVMTDLVKKTIRSYQQLPCTFYQIQTKFRDEIRPRFGVMRGREFVMKDAYSFHLTQDSLVATYETMLGAYTRIFERLGLRFKAVAADSGNIGGHVSHEFHVLAEAGEDCIVCSANGEYAANIDLVPAPLPAADRPTGQQTMASIATPHQKTVQEVGELLQIQTDQILKTLLVKSAEGGMVALVLRGDHRLNRTKAEALSMVASPLVLVEEAHIKATLGCSPGFIGPVGLTESIPIIADHSAAVLADFVCGANREGQHLTGVNWGRDVDEPITTDLRDIQAGETSPEGGDMVNMMRGIEVGHIFQLGTKYSQVMQAHCLDPQGKAVDLIMGCYGIGISRVVAATIEQNFDAQGIVWPTSMAPFHLALIPINMHKSQRLREAVMALYHRLQAANIEILLDDRRERPGVMFSDMELIGIPHRLVFSERGLDAGQIEYKHRASGDQQIISLDNAVVFIQDKMAQEIISS